MPHDRQPDVYVGRYFLFSFSELFTIAEYARPEHKTKIYSDYNILNTELHVRFECGVSTNGEERGETFAL